MPRITPITRKAELSAEHQPIADDIVKVFGRIGGPFSMLLHSPKLAERLLPLVTFFRDESVVETPLRTIAVLTAVREQASAYPWAAQVNLARKNGVRDEVIDVIRTQGDPGRLSDDERDVMTYARQLLRGPRTDPALFDRLHRRHGAAWMVEVTTAVHYFALVAGVANAFEIAPPPDGDRLPA